MNKIAEQKALEAYPINEDNYWNKFKREGYIKCYDQVMQDLLEKACEYLRIEFVDMWLRCTRFSVDEEIEKFKNYMQDEM